MHTPEPSAEQDDNAEAHAGSHHGHPKNYHPPKPYWRRAHADWKFWIAVVFIFGALAIYIFSVDLALVPRH